jgi:hypothetical protein
MAATHGSNLLRLPRLSSRGFGGRIYSKAERGNLKAEEINRLSANQEFDGSHSRGDLSDPEEEHPLDDFGFDFRSVLFCHEPLGHSCSRKAISKLSAMAHAFGGSIFAVLSCPPW